MLLALALFIRKIHILLKINRLTVFSISPYNVKNMLKIITSAPIYVWPLLYYLVSAGLKARNARTIPVKNLLIAPIIFLAWACYSAYIAPDLHIVNWTLRMLGGAWLGWALIQRVQLRFDKEKMTVQLPGSWQPLILSMAIFSIRYFLGATYATEPTWTNHPTLLMLDSLVTTLSGIFIGRLLGYWSKYRAAPHESLAI